MRLFIALNFNEEIKTRLSELREQLRAQSATGNFTHDENFHLTLAFLGETPKEKLDLLINIMEEVRSPPFDIILNRTGCFNRGYKELWWIGADPASSGLQLLRTIHGHLVSRLETEGFPVDKRPLSAHITLGREIIHPRPIVLDTPELTVRADNISLMKSEHIRGKLTYTEIGNFRLQN
ncbi:MAG: RNA 2',3'-cyclic phosphodiesterase [Treponema sp.]|nr:RNA 2',3'-cyclic phosphodiesterase [Treponema sp.]